MQKDISILDKMVKLMVNGESKRSGNSHGKIDIDANFCNYMIVLEKKR